MDGIWNDIWSYDPHNYLKGLILCRIVFAVDWYNSDKEPLSKELWLLANLQDASCKKPNADEECEAVKGWDYLYLKENYSLQGPSIVSLEHVAGCALNYIRAKRLTGDVSGQEALVYFEWDKL